MEEVLGKWDPQQTMCSWKLNRAIGDHLKHHAKGRRHIEVGASEKCSGICARHLPILEMGLDVALE